jgi:hypothetical protein
VAFRRRKRVHQYEYYQAVRNYRDGDGKHRQEVFCHLGVHGSLEVAIAARRAKGKIYRDRAFALRERTKALRSTLLALYGWELVNGAIPVKGKLPGSWITGGRSGNPTSPPTTTPPTTFTPGQSL